MKVGDIVKTLHGSVSGIHFGWPTIVGIIVEMKTAGDARLVGVFSPHSKHVHINWVFEHELEIVDNADQKEGN